MGKIQDHMHSLGLCLIYKIHTYNVQSGLDNTASTLLEKHPWMVEILNNFWFLLLSCGFQVFCSEQMVLPNYGKKQSDF